MKAKWMKWSGTVAPVLGVFVLLCSLGCHLEQENLSPRTAFVSSIKAKTKHLVVISLDGLRAADFEYFKGLPNFKALLEGGSYAGKVTCVYPSVTYPSHTSIVTGRYPMDHGVYSNTLFQPGEKEPDWYWQSRYIKTPTLFGIAKEAHMKTGALLWPVTAGADIDYNLPEIFPTRGQSQIWLSLTNGSPWFSLELELRFGSIRKGSREPELSDFIAASAEYLLRSGKPDLMLVHLNDLDKQRHTHGVLSQEALEALIRHDRRLGRIVQGAKDAGIYDDTTFVVLGDHGFLDTGALIRINVLFKQAGIISVDSNGKLIDWKAIAHTCGGSTYVKLKDPADEATRKKVEQILAAVSNDPGSGVESVFTGEQVAALGASREYDYMLEAREGYYFSDGYDGEPVMSFGPEDVNYRKGIFAANHGYLPTKAACDTFFLASGAGVRRGVILERIAMVDEGPTMAELLGLNIPGATGRVLWEILR